MTTPDLDEVLQIRCATFHREKLRRLARARDHTMSDELREYIENAPEPIEFADEPRPVRREASDREGDDHLEKRAPRRSFGWLTGTLERKNLAAAYSNARPRAHRSASPNRVDT